MATTDDAGLYASRHNHPQDPAQPCLEQTMANNRSKRGQCLVQAALAQATAAQAVLGDQEEHFQGCPCGRCQLIRAQRIDVAVAAQKEQPPCTCQHSSAASTMIAA